MPKRPLGVMLLVSIIGLALAGQAMMTATRASDPNHGLPSVLALSPATDAVSEQAAVEQQPAVDAADLTWTNGVPCPTGLSRLAAVVAGNKLHIVTGEVSGGGRAQQTIFNFATHTWSTGLAHPGGGISNSDAAAVSDTLICVGSGYDNNATIYNYMTKLDLTANTWTQAAAMPQAGWLYFAMAASGGNAYVFGGVLNQTTLTNAAYRYDVARDSFTALASMPLALRSQSAVAIGDTVYLIGGAVAAGQPYTGTTNFLKYSISGNTWTTGAAMPFGVMWGRAVAYDDPSDGWVIYVFGGYSSTSAVTNAVWAYTLGTGQWTQCSSLLAARRSHGGTIYADTVLAVCGYTGSAFLTSVEWGAISMNLSDDVGVTAITVPGSFVNPTPVTPTATIRNFGTDPQSDIPVTCWIDSAGTRVYDYSAVFGGPLNQGGTGIVEFAPDWTPGPAGNVYRVTVFTGLVGDLNPDNDTAVASTTVSAAVFAETLVVNRIPMSDGPTIDGVISPWEWRASTQYDISDLLGRAGTPRPANSNIGYYLYDDAFMYFAMDCPGVTVRTDYDQFGPYMDEDRSGTWDTDSSEGNYWMEYVGGDSAIYRAILDTVPNIWRMGLGLDAVSAISVASGHVQMEAKVPFGDRKSDFSVLPGDTVGYFQYTATAGSNYWGWWPQSLTSTYWARPSYYGPMVFSPSVAVAEERPVAPGHALYRISNPVRGSATVRYYLARQADARVGIYDAAGSLVRLLARGVQQPGVRSLVWDRTDEAGRRVAEGTYFVRLTSGASSVTAKAVLVR